MNVNAQQDLNPHEGDWYTSDTEQRSEVKALNFAPAITIANNGSKSNSEEGGLDVGQIFKVVQRRFWIIILLNILMMGAAVAWNRTRPLAYEGSFKILIEPATAEGQVVSALKGNQMSVEEQDLGAAQNAKVTIDYPTQIQILLSDKILLPVIQELKNSHPQISGDTLKSSLTINRFKEQSETKMLEVRYTSRSSSETQQVINLVSQAYIKYSLSERQTNVRRAVQFVDSQLPKIQVQVRDLELALQTFREKNQLIDPTTLGSQLGTQTSNIQQEQITTQIELAKQKQLYNSLQQQLQLQPREAEAASVLSDAPGYQQLVKQLQDIDIELQTQSAQLTDENPKMILLREKRDKLLPLLKAKANSVLGSKVSQITVNPQSLPYQNALRQDLSKQFIAASNQIQVLEAKQNGLSLANQTLLIQTSQLPVISRQYENIQRRLKLATEQLSKFSQKREELMINAARQEIPWELIASPAVKKMSSSNLLNDLLLGLGAGFLMGTGIALFLEKLNDVIYSAKDLTEELNISILGMIPIQEDKQSSRLNKNEEVVSLVTEIDSARRNTRYQFSPFIESFRALNSQIRLLSPHLPIKSLVVSSSVSAEGKTTVAIHLAQAAAAMGQRVLLVNADLRKVNSQDISDQNNNLIHGLADVIMGHSQLMNTVKLFPGKENLYVLPAGSTVLDPTSLLGSQKMQNLMKKCQHNFDLVIYDTVPLNFADALLLIPQTDGLLMVTSLGKVRREDLRNSLSTLEVSKVPVLGLVINMVNGFSSQKVKSRSMQVVTANEVLSH